MTKNQKCWGLLLVWVLAHGAGIYIAWIRWPPMSLHFRWITLTAVISSPFYVLIVHAVDKKWGLGGVLSTRVERRLTNTPDVRGAIENQRPERQRPGIARQTI